MDMPFVLWLVALGVITAAVGAFFWATRRSQSDDFRPPAWRVPDEDEPGRIHHPGVAMGRGGPRPRG